MSSAFLAWQDPVSRRWLPIGKLTQRDSVYRFEYTVGAQQAHERHQFEALPSFPRLGQIYESDELFPLFKNRLLSKSRPEYTNYIEWLNVPENEEDPIVLLSRGGGRRETDSYEIVPCPEPTEEGVFHIHFFAHGLRHLPQASLDRIGTLQVDDTLLLAHDYQNPHDPEALIIRTDSATADDPCLVGFCPRYLTADVLSLKDEHSVRPRVSVERVNAPPAPTQLRLLCSLTATWPAGFRPFQGGSYRAMSEEESSPRD